MTTEVAAGPDLDAAIATFKESRNESLEAWWCGFGDLDPTPWRSAPTAPEAICRAALAAKSVVT